MDVDGLFFRPRCACLAAIPILDCAITQFLICAMIVRFEPHPGTGAGFRPANRSESYPSTCVFGSNRQSFAESYLVIMIVIMIMIMPFVQKGQHTP